MPERLSESWHSNHAKLLLDYVPSVLQNEFLLLLFYRTTLALLTRSTFVPDETFQFVEPAFRVVHGVGIQYVDSSLDHNISSREQHVNETLTLLVHQDLGMDIGFSHSKLCPAIASDPCLQSLGICG